MGRGTRPARIAVYLNVKKMDDRTLQFRVGVVVLSAILLTAILITLFGDFPKWLKKQKTFYVKFPQAPGVAEGTPVRKDGILIGRVEKHELLKPSGVRIAIMVDDDVEITENHVCRIKSTLLGDAMLEFIPGDKEELAQNLLLDGAEIDGRVVENPLDLMTDLGDDVKKALSSVTRAGDEIGKMSESFNKILKDTDEKQIKRILDDTEKMLKNFNQTLGSFSETIGNLGKLFGDEDNRKKLQKGLAQVPDLITEGRESIAHIERVTSQAETNLKNLEGFTKPLGQRGDQIARQIDSSLAQLNTVLSQLAEFSKKVNNNQGTLGELVHNPELYNRLNAAAANIEAISKQLRPIVNDARVFTDKIARDPGRLGVSGAIQKRSNTKYPNFGHTPPPPDDWHKMNRPGQK